MSNLGNAGLLVCDYVEISEGEKNTINLFKFKPNELNKVQNKIVFKIKDKSGFFYLMVLLSTVFNNCAPCSNKSLKIHNN